MLKADGFDLAVIGVGSRCGQPDILVYDSQLCIDTLMDGGMGHDEAVDYFEFNVAGAWVGDDTPLFVDLCSLEDIEEEPACPS